MPARIDIEFARRPRRLRVPGLIVLLIGCVFSYWVFADFRNGQMRSELLEMQLDRYTAAAPRTSKATDGLETAVQIAAVTQPLTTPWSALLNDLEVAVKDSGNDIAVLQVAPDRGKRQVRISAEARSLPAIFDYMITLQEASTLRHPILEQHEVRTAIRERPVRFEISAEWRLSDD